QVEDYSLDLRDFHKQSSSRTLIPILWASHANEKLNQFFDNGDFVKPTLFSNTQNLHVTIKSAFDFYTDQTNTKLDPLGWNNSEYLPTPTIIEAAQHLFSR